MQQHWFKMSTRFWDDNKVLHLREITTPLRFYRAAALFQVLLGTHAEAEGQGELTGRRCSVSVLAHRVAEDEPDVDRALRDLEDAGFIERGKKKIVLVGWSTYWGKVSGAALRMRRYRARQRTAD